MDGIQLYNEVNEVISRYSEKGEKALSTGVRLICPTPQVAPEAWLHVVFPPLSSEKILMIEQQLKKRLPEPFTQFLGQTNGLMMFSYYIDIWGVRENMARTSELAWQPHDLVQNNLLFGVPSNSPDNVVFFGSVSDNWCFFELNERNYRVGKTDRYTFDPFAWWDCFSDWLIFEMNSFEKNLG